MTHSTLQREIKAAAAAVRAARRVVAFSGAGLSAESGVPTFRSGNDPNALWAQFDPTELASPQGFRRHPDVVLAWYADRRRRLGGVQPNAAHRALAARPDIRQITQNVDDLLERAGATDVLHLHGEIGRDRCHAACGYVEDVDLASPPANLRNCPTCAAPLRPGVVWFGEALDEAVMRESAELASACDLMLVIGTSGVVWPAAGLVDVARSAEATIVVVNTERSGVGADHELIGRAGDLVPQLV